MRAQFFIKPLFLLFVTSIVFYSETLNAQIIFSETFDEGTDATSGNDDTGGVAWSTTCTECLDGGDYFKIQSGELVGQDTNGPAQWETEAIDVSSCDFIKIEFDLSEEGTMEACGEGCNATDFVQLEYNIDGAGWTAPVDATFCSGECANVWVIQSDDIDGGFRHYETGCIGVGSELQVRITVQAWAASERWILDNIEISCDTGFELDAGSDQTICEGESVTLTADNPDGATISWSDGVTDGVSFTPPVGEEDYVVTGELGTCLNTDTVTVTVLSAPTVEVEPAGPYSVDSGIQTMEATPGGGSWSASCGTCIDETTGEFDPDAAGVGVWEVCYTAGVAPCDATECIDVVVTEDCLLSGVITANDPTCFGFSDGSATINMTGIVGEVTYVITSQDGEVVNVDNSNTANSLEEGWYIFTITDEAPCTFIDSVFIDDPMQMDVDLVTSNPLCFGDNSGFAFVDTVLHPTGDYSQIEYIWTPNTGENGIGEDSLFNAGAGEYSLIVNDENGCSVTLDFELEDPAELYFAELDYSPAYCRLFDYQSGNGVVKAAAAGGTPDYDYIWENLETGETTINTTWGSLNPGSYQITITDNNGCQISDIIEVDSLNPMADFIMESEQFETGYSGTAVVTVDFTNISEYFSNINNPSTDTTFFWDFGTGGPAVLSENVEDTYTIDYAVAGDYEVCLVAINENGCRDTACKIITVYDTFYFTPANVFTPNNDNINDVFSFRELSQSVSSFNCVIYNRWGTKVAELNSITDEWDGTTEGGNEASQGTYFYVYSGESDNGTIFEGQGTVQLMGR